MIELSYYSPACWTDDGLLVKLASREYQATDKTHRSRRGKWLKAAVVAIGAGTMIASAGIISFSTTPTAVGEVVSSGPKLTLVRLHPDEQRVPDGYWDGLKSALRSVSRLPAQDASQDPPALV